MAMAGLASHLRARADIQLLTERQFEEAQVSVVAIERITPAASVLRAAAHASAPKIVLITDELRESDLSAAIERVQRDILRAKRTVKNIVQAVLSRLQLRNRAPAVAYGVRVSVI
jgi:hypothetical protein